jgi:hypothetical protein
MLDHARREVAKQRVIAQQGQLVPNALHRLLAACSRHEAPCLAVDSPAILDAREVPVRSRIHRTGITIAQGYREGGAFFAAAVSRRLH